MLELISAHRLIEQQFCADHSPKETDAWEGSSPLWMPSRIVENHPLYILNSQIPVVHENIWDNIRPWEYPFLLVRIVCYRVFLHLHVRCTGHIRGYFHRQSRVSQQHLSAARCTV